MFYAMKNKKGFTLVEILVVLVILVLMASLLIPKLIGYVDEAKKKTIITDARSQLISTESVFMQYYGVGKNLNKIFTEYTTLAGTGGNIKGTLSNDTVKDINALSRLSGTISELIIDTAYQIISFQYSDQGYTATYSRSSGTVSGVWTYD